VTAEGWEGGLPPFDALHAVGDVQRQAMDGASRVIGQLLDLAGRAAHDARAAGDPLDVAEEGDAPPGAGAPPDAGFGAMRAEMARAVDLYVDLFRRTFEAYADLTEAALRRRGVTVAGAGEADALTLQAAGDGAEAPFWVHNGTGAPTEPEAVTTTPLCAHTGEVVAAKRVWVEPSPLPAVPAGQSGAALVRVDLAGVPGGRYVGHLLTSHGALPLHVVVPGLDGEGP
jgi:hypothetical protein